MWKLRYYLPLIAFVVPSAAIGYLIVIPRSGVSGLNSLTIGFAATLIGATIAYAMGIASATRNSCPRARPWSVRINHYINSQASNPHGLFGRLLGQLWKRDHRAINRTTLDLLECPAGSHLLEIGCGPGEALHDAAKRGYSIVGLDVSATMTSIARKRNRREVNSGRVSVRLVQDGKFDLEPGACDGAFSVHCVYFWKEPEHTLSEIAAALKLGGRIALAFTPDTPQVPARFRNDVHRFYMPDEMVKPLADAGFEDVRTIRLPHVSESTVWIAKLLSSVAPPQEGRM